MIRYLVPLFALLAFTSVAQGERYTLEIARRVVENSGSPVEKLTINGSIPGPTLYFTEGEEAVVEVVNQTDEDTSIHWHGLLLPGAMDGVPGLNGFTGIHPGGSFTYRFPIRQSGTYWYHSHSLGQEQDGIYGALVIKPNAADGIVSDRDYVVLLSDFHQQNWEEILHNLKMSSDYYNYSKRTIGDFFSDIRKRGFKEAWRFVSEWGSMRMSPSDLSDVSGYTFLVNGRSSEGNWTGIFQPGERVRLRFVNASAMTIYDVRIPGLRMTVVQADGQNVEPVTVDEFRFGVAETYDVIVEPKDDRAYTIAAESIDRSGFALATLAPREGMRGETPEPRKRTLLTMADMGMGHSEHGGTSMEHGAMNHSMHMKGDAAAIASGWADAGTPAGDKALRYADLRALSPQREPQQPAREVEIRLGGNMERYIWTINGKRHQDSGPIVLKYGEKIRLKYINDTMMAHPMHLHGMFVQLENGQTRERLPNKHTVIIPPGTTYSVFLIVDEPGEWAFHCHLLYHMLSGMMTTVIVPEQSASPREIGELDGHHGH